VPVLHQTEEQAAAEAAWRAVIDAQWADVQLLLQRWPDRTSPECVAAEERLRRQAAPGGAADQALAALHALYGGYALVPEAVRRRLERYAQEQLGGRPWPRQSVAADRGR
jgi:hypothetical protein